MFSAIRRGRREARSADRPKRVVGPSPLDVLVKNCQNGLQHASECVAQLGEEFNHRLGAVFEHLQAIEPKHQTLLLASISNSVEPKAVLPNKKRLQNGGADNLNSAQLSSKDGRKEDEERILISEVRPRPYTSHLYVNPFPITSS